MMKVDVDYSTKEDEKSMYKKLNDNFDDIKISKIINKTKVKNIIKILEDIHISDNIFEYVSDLIQSTRTPEKYGFKEMSKYLTY
jgi:MoxR-like ATPase